MALLVWLVVTAFVLASLYCLWRLYDAPADLRREIKRLRGRRDALIRALAQHAHDTRGASVKLEELVLLTLQALTESPEGAQAPGEAPPPLGGCPLLPTTDERTSVLHILLDALDAFALVPHPHAGRCAHDLTTVCLAVANGLVRAPDVHRRLMDQLRDFVLASHPLNQRAAWIDLGDPFQAKRDQATSETPPQCVARVHRLPYWPDEDATHAGAAAVLALVDGAQPAVPAPASPPPRPHDSSTLFRAALAVSVVFLASYGTFEFFRMRAHQHLTAARSLLKDVLAAHPEELLDGHPQPDPLQALERELHQQAPPSADDIVTPLRHHLAAAGRYYRGLRQAYTRPTSDTADTLPEMLVNHAAGREPLPKEKWRALSENDEKRTLSFECRDLATAKEVTDVLNKMKSPPNHVSAGLPFTVSSQDRTVKIVVHRDPGAHNALLQFLDTKVVSESLKKSLLLPDGKTPSEKSAGAAAKSAGEPSVASFASFNLPNVTAEAGPQTEQKPTQKPGDGVTKSALEKAAPEKPADKSPSQDESAPGTYENMKRELERRAKEESQRAVELARTLFSWQSLLPPGTADGDSGRRSP